MDERQGDRPGVAGRLSREEFADLFQQSSPKLWCIAAAITTDPAQADDLLQDAAVIALEKTGQFTPSTSFTAWMGQIVRFVSLNQRKRTIRNRLQPTDPEHFDRVPANVAAPARAVHGNGTLARDQKTFDDDVLRALRSLSETARACLLLRTVLELPYEEIARALDIPAATAMSHVHRSRQRMRDLLEQRRGDDLEDQS